MVLQSVRPRQGEGGKMGGCTEISLIAGLEDLCVYKTNHRFI